MYNRFARGAELFSEPKEIAGPEKGREVSRTRYLIAALGIEGWGKEAKQLAGLLYRCHPLEGFCQIGRASPGRDALAR